ncbi:DNA-directed RNA polymerase [Catenaria anguillulae PL171]|uniref:DNA-directed RNA polymerase n=1 Tax=Catenaria anguillulae PL171 TaxID=765915 RepID=A0A1Y2HQY2_9FUNG|nr:DNA-directed RNA polymerase [Catenaria anguillulae PL171]
MNQPDRSEAILLPMGTRKLTVTEDTRLPNAIEVRIEREDHTIAGLIKSQLLKDERILFAGYKHPHPLEHHIIFKIQSIPGVQPVEVLKTALNSLILEFSTIKAQFMEEMRRAQEAAKSAQTMNAGHDNDY